MPSHYLAKIKIDDLDILGYSVAGEETVIGLPQLDVCFDIGKAPDQLISINHILLTHGHMDHAAGIAYYLSHRKFNGMSEGTVLTPPNTVKPGWMAIASRSNLSRPSRAMNIRSSPT
jgi:ribonuclease Z